MKLPFTICGSRFAIGKKSPPAANRRPAAGSRKSAGIALVITLIMLSVTLIMAVAFLAIARRERGAVSTTTDTAGARLAADTALAAAQAQVIASLLSGKSAAYDFSLLVSTNYINYTFGFQPDISSPTNVDYYDAGGNLLAGNNQMQNIANLWFLPRAPVFVTTNQQTGSNDFRFYLDLNRNGQFEANGLVNNVDNNGKPITNSQGSSLVSEVGDPEWVGILEHPDQPHGPNNHFIARYAFLAQPIGNSLDLNYIHNQARNPNLNSAQDGYFRNEGVGSWELNLAAFLADLNTNQWDTVFAPYSYNQTNGFPNAGNAFFDAFNLLTNRYAGYYNSLAVPPLNFYNALVNAGIDGYTLGNLMTNTFLPLVSAPSSGLNSPWAGSDNTNRFFALPTELFDPTKSSPYFTNRLLNAGTNLATYDRYTFYNLLAELGTDSTAEGGKLNLNYRNVTNGVIVPGMQTNLYPWTALEFFTNAADRMLRLYTTNWFASSPSNYLQSYYGFYGYNYYHHDPYGNIVTNDPTGFGLTNVPFIGMTNQVPAFGLTGIPVYVYSNFVYSSAINRVLQLAANIYDATTNSFYPSVFRPLFSKDNAGNIFITGYTNLNSQFGVGTVSGFADPQLSTPVDVTTVAALSGVLNNVSTNIYGVPWIIGAKKGLPNFNEFSMENIMGVTRRLQLTRASTNAAPPTNVDFSKYRTNQMYMMNFSSSLGVELWNSYANNYSGSVLIGLNVNSSLTITNDDRNVVNPLRTVFFSTNVIMPVNSWHGTTPSYAGNPNTYSFVITNFSGPTFTNSVYRSSYATGVGLLGSSGFTAPCLVPTNYLINYSPGSLLYETNSQNGFYFPKFGVLLTNQLQVFILDFNVTNGLYHVIDYAHFAGPKGGFDVNSNLVWNDVVNNHAGVWDTNYPSASSAPYGVTAGILQQIASSKSGTAPAIDEKWNGDPEAVPSGGNAAQQAAFFLAFFKAGNVATVTASGNTASATNLQLVVQAPYSPTRYISQYITWQANDPLVHYLAGDIDATLVSDPSKTPQPGIHSDDFYPSNALTSLNLGVLNDHYTPWGGNPHLKAEEQAQQFDTNSYNLAERDPLMSQPDNWDFPANKLPSVGWLGRVHRGTPWQTVFLKSTNILANGNAVWQTWTGDGNAYDAVNSAPVQDSRLFDLFTAALNDNATRGTLSVNQTHLAAWSALFSGLAVPTSTTNSFTIIDPAGSNGTNSILWQLVNNTTNGIAGINTARANTNLFSLGAFSHLGDILHTPAFSDQSPLLAGLDTAHISDEVYEWLPQQTLGLLRAPTAPRYVIYCYGQSLKPAPNGVVTSSATLPSGLNPFGLVTNYQVMAESAVRAVVTVHPQVTPTLTGFVTNYTMTVESYNVLPPN